MYVAALDRPWEGTPFAFQGFVLRSDAQMDALRKHCKSVYIDLDLDETASEAPAAPLQGILRHSYAETVEIERELPAARNAVASAEAAVAKALRSFADGTGLDATELRAEVTNLTQSVMRNPHAAALLSVMREGAEYLFDRAMHTSVYMIMFTRFLGMEHADVELAGLVGLVQDVAMVSLPHELVTKNGPLTPEEVGLMRTHVDRGMAQLSETQGISAEVVRLAAMHHERFDGSGYPKGLHGKDMPTIAACSGLVDTYSAMTRARPYAKPIAPSTALGMLYKWRGKSFHPTLVEEFIRCIGAFPVGSVIELNTGEVGIVISQDPNKRLQPRIMIVRDAKGSPIRPQKLLDLSRSPKASPTETYRITRTLEFGRSGVSMRDIAV